MEKDSNKEQLQKKIKKLKFLLPALLLVFGLLLILIATWTSEQEKPTNLAETEGETKGEPFHHSYSPDSNQDPFQNNQSAVAVNGFTFLEPVDLSKRLKENTNSFLTGINDQMMLFRAYGEVAYIYNQKENIHQVIGQNIPEAVLCDNPQYVAYISDKSFRTPQIIPYEMGLGNAQPLFTAAYDEKITNIVCDDQHIYFTVENVDGEKTSHLVTLQEFQGKIPPSEASITVDNTSEFISKNKNGVYVYLPGKNAFHHFNPFKTDVNDIPVQVKDNVSRFLQMKLNDNGDYVAVYYDKDLFLKGTVNGEVLDEFSNLAIADWYDETHILFLDTNTLYLYDIQSKEKEVLKTNVSNFVLAKGDIYFHDSVGNLYLMKRKTEE